MSDYQDEDGEYMKQREEEEEQYRLDMAIIAELKAQYDAEVKLNKIVCTSKIDCLKGNWYLWEAERHLPNGYIEHGTVQADGQGELIAKETFERED